MVLEGFLALRVPLWCRRLITMLPALAILALGIDPLKALVLSQVALSLKLQFTVLPLIVFTGSKAIMGEFQSGPVPRIVPYATTVILDTVILMMNGALLGLTLANSSPHPLADTMPYPSHIFPDSAIPQKGVHCLTRSKRLHLPVAIGCPSRTGLLIAQN